MAMTAVRLCSLNACNGVMLGVHGQAVRLFSVYLDFNLSFVFDDV